ncbi:MAG: DUF2958 domain-containing protein [Lentisphaerae bacterium]|nr:DUF2958 domain-containing protein [Lentisphaerota bacterium]
MLTKAVLAKFPKWRSTDGQGGDAAVVVKFFTPDSNWTWYATEFDGEDTFFGLVEGFEKEFGYFSLTELAGAKGPMGLSVERDRYFGFGKTLRDVAPKKFD